MQEIADEPTRHTAKGLEQDVAEFAVLGHKY